MATTQARFRCRDESVNDASGSCWPLLAMWLSQLTSFLRMMMPRYFDTVTFASVCHHAVCSRSQRVSCFWWQAAWYILLGGRLCLSSSPILQVGGGLVVTGVGPGRTWQPCTLQCRLQTALPARSIFPVDRWYSPGINTVQIIIDPWGTTDLMLTKSG